MVTMADIPGFSLSVVKRHADFTLDVGWSTRGGLTVLLGYSGSGKSLTLSLLTGASRPDSGRVRFGDEVLCDVAAGVFVPPQARGFGFVSQSSELFPHLSVRKNISFGLHALPRRERGERVDEMLASFGMEHLADRMPSRLSGGERQRAAIARALACRPRALILDEPFSALDLPVRAEMRDLIRRTQKEWRIPIVMVTHDLYEAAILADSLVVYAGGGVVQTGSLAELVSDPGTPEVRRLLHSVELPASVLRAAESLDAA